MTRVNVVPVQKLTDQHLMAEWRELKHIPPAWWRAWNAARCCDETLMKRIPDSYRMGAGHVMFFLDKLGYIESRYANLTSELVARRFNLTEGHCLDPRGLLMWARKDFMKNYVPTPEDIAINQARIDERIAAKPGMYRYGGRLID